MEDNLIDLIPKEQLKIVLDSPYCELEPDFLCFDEVYKTVKNNTPECMTIIDLGCYAGLQSYFFKDFRGYVGVDNCPDKDEGGLWIPRVGADNSRFYTMSIQEFIRRFDEFELDKNNCMAVMSYVPDLSAYEKAVQFFPNIAAYYPGNHYKDNLFRLDGACKNFSEMIKEHITEDYER